MLTTRWTWTCLCVFAIACDSAEAPDEVSEESQEIDLSVDGVAESFDDVGVALCSEGFPDDLVFSIAATDPECPEAHTLGPAGNEILRGNICVELSVQLLQPIGWTVGVPISAEGSSWAMLGFYRYEDPPLTVNTGDTGPGVGMPTGEVTIWSITPLADGSYEIEFSVAVSGDTEVLASGTITAVPDFCTAA